MILQKNRPNNIDNLVINADLSKPVVEQLAGITVLRAEIFRFSDPTKFSDIIIGIDTDLYLDMLLDIKKLDKEEGSSLFFATSIEDDYNRIVKESEQKMYLRFNDGMLTKLDKDFNEQIIRESYYE
jgi:hypothetical protein